MRKYFNDFMDYSCEKIFGLFPQHALLVIIFLVWAIGAIVGIALGGLMWG